MHVPRPDSPLLLLTGIVQVVGVCMLDTEQLDAMKDSGCLLTLANYVTTTEPQGQVYKFTWDCLGNGVYFVHIQFYYTTSVFLILLSVLNFQLDQVFEQ